MEYTVSKLSDELNESKLNEATPKNNDSILDELMDDSPILNEDDDIGKKELAENKSVDVYNALNLCCEGLGELYETEGYNPFGNNFVLTEDFTNDILEAKNNNEEINTEEFLETNNKKIAKNFQKAYDNNKKLLDKLGKELNSITDPNVKDKMEKMIVTVKNRGELLKQNIQKLKQKDANALNMYKKLFGLDSELSKLLKDEFTEEVNTNIVVQKMIGLCNQRASKIKLNNLLVKEKSKMVEQEKVEEAIQQNNQTLNNQQQNIKEQEINKDNHQEHQENKQQQQKQQKQENKYQEQDFSM